MGDIASAERQIRRLQRQRDRLLRLAREMRDDLEAVDILRVNSVALRRMRVAREIERLTEGVR